MEQISKFEKNTLLVAIGILNILFLCTIILYVWLASGDRITLFEPSFVFYSKYPILLNLIIIHLFIISIPFYHIFKFIKSIKNVLLILFGLAQLFSTVYVILSPYIVYFVGFHPSSQTIEINHFFFLLSINYFLAILYGFIINLFKKRKTLLISLLVLISYVIVIYFVINGKKPSYFYG